MFVNIAGSWLGTSLLLGTQRGISEFRVSVGQFSRSEKWDLQGISGSQSH